MGGERGNGEGEGGSVYSQPGTRVDGNSCHDTKEDFQVSKGGISKEQRGLSKRGYGHAPQCIYCANKRLCLGYK